MFTNDLNMGLLLWAKKTVHRVKTDELYSKEKVLGIAVIKEDHVF